MIWESHFWKDDLLKKAASLRKSASSAESVGDFRLW